MCDTLLVQIYRNQIHMEIQRKRNHFFSTKPPVIEDIHKKTEVEKVHKFIKKLVCGNTSGYDAVSKPRNIKQRHNVRQVKRQYERLIRMPSATHMKLLTKEVSLITYQHIPISALLMETTRRLKS